MTHVLHERSVVSTWISASSVSKLRPLGFGHSVKGLGLQVYSFKGFSGFRVQC